MDRSNYPTRLLRLGDPEPNDLRHTTSAERLEMVWPLTVEAWAFMEGKEDESGFRQDVVRVVRGGRTRDLADIEALEAAADG